MGMCYNAVNDDKQQVFHFGKWSVREYENKFQSAGNDYDLVLLIIEEIVEDSNYKFADVAYREAIARAIASMGVQWIWCDVDGSENQILGYEIIGSVYENDSDVGRKIQRLAFPYTP